MHFLGHRERDIEGVGDVRESPEKGCRALRPIVPRKRSARRRWQKLCHRSTSFRGNTDSTRPEHLPLEEPHKPCILCIHRTPRHLSQPEKAVHIPDLSLQTLRFQTREETTSCLFPGSIVFRINPRIGKPASLLALFIGSAQMKMLETEQNSE